MGALVALATMLMNDSIKTDCRRGTSLWKQSSDPPLPTTAQTSERRTQVCVLEDPVFSHEASQVADRLSLPLISSRELQEYTEGFSFVLSILPYEFGSVKDYAVGISGLGGDSRERKRKVTRKRKLSTKPFCVDFFPPNSSRLGQRKESKSADLLIQAVAPTKGGEAKVVYDLTAGWGQDSLLIANSGAKQVHMIERDPIVAFLLEDALRRLRLISESINDPAKEQAKRLSRCLSLEVGEGIQIAMRDASNQPDVVYLDPMFPVRRKSAAVRKNMQILQGLLGSQKRVVQQESSHRLEQEEEAALLQAAHQLAGCSVVIKRPIHASPLGGEAPLQLPSHAITGSVNRWDVYTKSSGEAAKNLTRKGV
jgi:16S rRNA (guanine1516-N2)-methyltransferase